jgi:hypothetical protein
VKPSAAPEHGAPGTPDAVRAMGSDVTGTPRTMMNQALRYERVRRWIAANRVERALEVGSGASGLAAWWPGPVTGVDLRFDGTPPPNLTTVEGSVFALPFPDRSHDAVICTDVMEHLPPGRRAEALTELLRVSSRLAWVSFPCGPDAVEADRRLAAMANRMGREAPGWLLDHQEHGLPMLDEALTWPAPGFRRGWAWSLPVRRHLGVLLAEHAPGGAALDRLARVGAVRAGLLGRPGADGGHYRLELWFARAEATT